MGDDAAEPAFDDATSYSARRQASEQYTLPSVCLSQARQKSGDQSISMVIVCVGVGGGVYWVAGERWSSREVFEGGRRLLKEPPSRLSMVVQLRCTWISMMV